MHYTRAQLADHYKINKGKLRRILKALQLELVQVDRTTTGRPVFYYDDNTISQINTYIDDLIRKKQR